MPQFWITTLETWEHRVDYTVDAPTLVEAYEQIQGQQHAYDRHEVIGSGDKVLFMQEAADESGEIPVPPEFGEQAEQPQPKAYSYDRVSTQAQLPAYARTIYCLTRDDGAPLVFDTEDEAEEWRAAYLSEVPEGDEPDYLGGPLPIIVPGVPALNPRELATVLAALRYCQDEMHDVPEFMDEFKDSLHFEAHTPLTSNEIDSLCERLNLNSPVRKPTREEVVVFNGRGERTFDHLEFPCEKCGKVETLGTGSAICEACEAKTE